MKRIWLLMLLASIVVSLQGCKSLRMGSPKDLVVVEHTDTVCGAKSGIVTNGLLSLSMCLLMVQGHLSIQ